MGEFAKLNGIKVKIGTCSNMYFVRYENRTELEKVTGSIDPRNTQNLYWRLPFPDEDSIETGSYEDYNRGYLLPGFDDSELDENPGIIQLRHECGLLFNVPCLHGRLDCPEPGDGIEAFWNGRQTHWIELASIKNTPNGLYPIIRCRFCGVQWRCDWDDVLAHVKDLELLGRLENYAKICPEYVPCVK